MRIITNKALQKIIEEEGELLDEANSLHLTCHTYKLGEQIFRLYYTTGDTATIEEVLPEPKIRNWKLGDLIAWEHVNGKDVIIQRSRQIILIIPKEYIKSVFGWTEREPTERPSLI